VKNLRGTRTNPFAGRKAADPELFDYYVAQARAERAKAIAEFGGTLVARLSGIVVRLARHVPIASQPPVCRAVPSLDKAGRPED
jgi:hypothetical protein